MQIEQVTYHFAQQVDDWVEEFRRTAWEAFAVGVANIETPWGAKEVVLVRVAWENGGHLGVGLYIRPETTDGRGDHD